MEDVRASSHTTTTDNNTDNQNKSLNFSHLTSELSNRTVSPSQFVAISRVRGVSRTLTLHLYVAAAAAGSGSNSIWPSPSLLASYGHYGTDALKMLLYTVNSEHVGCLHLYPNSTANDR